MITLLRRALRTAFGIIPANEAAFCQRCYVVVPARAGVRTAGMVFCSEQCSDAAREDEL